jgi:hypothetical protein
MREACGDFTKSKENAVCFAAQNKGFQVPPVSLALLWPEPHPS